MYENYLPSSKLSSLKPEKYTGWLKEMEKDIKNISKDTKFQK